MSTKNRAELVAVLEDALMDDILAMSDSEIEQELNKVGASEYDYVSRSMTFISETVAASRKQLLIDARSTINKKSAPSITNSLITTVEAAQEFIVSLLTSPTLKENHLTTAFRDGEDIPDNDLISMANELKQLLESNEGKD